MKRPEVRPAVARIADAARFLNISRSTVYRLIDTGKLRTVKLGVGEKAAVGIRYSDLERFISQVPEDERKRGRGRPPLPASQKLDTQAYGIRTDRETWAKFQRLGGREWFERVVREAPEPEEGGQT